MPSIKPIFASRLLPLLILTLSLFSCTNNSSQYRYSIEDARMHMQQNNWDSARIYAVHVLAESQEKKDISLANAIIAMAKENLKSDSREFLTQKEDAFSELRKVYDLQENISWYYASTTTPYTNMESFHLYLGERANEYWLRFRVQYEGKKPLDLLGYTIQCADRDYTFAPESDMVHGREDDSYWEYFDQKYNETTHQMILDILASDQAKLILIGSGGNHERHISQDEIQAMREVLHAFKFSPAGNEYFEPLSLQD